MDCHKLSFSHVKHFGYPVYKHTTKDIIDFGDRLLLVATDRLRDIPFLVPEKGKIVTAISKFWFKHFAQIPNHIIRPSPRIAKFINNSLFDGRTLVCWNLEIIPIEFTVYGYLVYDILEEYIDNNSVEDHPLPSDLDLCDGLPKPICVLKDSSHARISFEQALRILPATESLRNMCVEMYRHALSYAITKGLIIVSSRFKFGYMSNKDGSRTIMLLDHIFTPDCADFWLLDNYNHNRNQQIILNPYRDIYGLLINGDV